MPSVVGSPLGNGAAIVTVGMPVFNGEQWLADAIESILGQTFADLLLVISDNASTDGTGEICQHFARVDNRVRYHRNPVNIGVYANYDQTFEFCSSPYFKWASASDICRSTFIERCVGVLERRPDVVLAYPKTALLDVSLDDARPYEDDLDLQDERPSERYMKLLERIRLNNVFNGVIRAAALRKTAMNRPHLSSDIQLIAELALQGKFVEVPERLFYRRMTRATSTAMKTQEENATFFRHEPGNVFRMTQWKIETGLAAGVWRASIPWREKMRAYGFLGRRLRHARHKLIRELLPFS